MRIPAILHHSALAVILTVLDEILRRLLTVPSARALDATRKIFASHQAAFETTAQHFRLVLCIASLLLLAALVHVGRQRAKRRNQRQPDVG